MRNGSIAALVLGCAMAGTQPAHAQDVATPVATTDCESLVHDAEELDAAGQFAEAARAYVDIARDRADCGQRADLLFRGANAYEAAHLLGRAIQVRIALIRNFSGNPLAGRAMYRIGASYEALALLDQAAEWYERFATEYPGLDERACTPTAIADGTCPIARVALERALTFRIALGEREAVVAGAYRYENTVGLGHPRDVARIVLAVGQVHVRSGAWSDVVTHYERFLRVYGGVALPHELIEANVILARAQLALHHPELAAPLYGTAVEIWEDHAEDRITAAASSPAERELWLARARDGASEALFEQASTLATSAHPMRLSRWSGGSAASLERWVRTGLAAWLAGRMAAVRSVEASYDRIAPLAEPRWQIAAAARVGALYRAIADDLRAVDVPPNVVRDEALHALYLQAIEDALDGTTPGVDGQRGTADDVVCAPGSTEPTCTSAPLFQATDRFERCATLSTSTRWADETASRCARALSELDTARPADDELRRTSTFDDQLVAAPLPPRH